MNSQFNTALKRVKQIGNVEICFGGIQFNTALKHVRIKLEFFNCFGGIQFNTALKPDAKKVWRWTLFWRHSIQHSSKT